MSYPLDREPEVVTFTYQQELVYVVDLSTTPHTVKVETAGLALHEVDFWAEGEPFLADVHPGFLIAKHRAIYRDAETSVESAIEYGCESADDVLRRPGLPEVE